MLSTRKTSQASGEEISKTVEVEVKKGRKQGGNIEESKMSER